MAKDYAKFVPLKPRDARYRSWRLALLFVLFLVISCFAAISYMKYATTRPGGNPKIEAFLEKLTTILNFHKKGTMAVLNTSSKTLAKTQSPPAVQFDFYNELPNMQVTTPEMAAASPAPAPVSTPTSAAAAVPAPAPALALASNKAALAETVPVPKKSPAVLISSAPKPPVMKLAQETVTTPPTHTAPKPIISADEFNGMLAAETQILRYVLQLGEFNTEPAAKRMLGALSDVGFKAEIVKSNKNGHSVYLIQQGPFPNMALAKAMQQSMQKRGIISVIHKTA